MKTMQNEMKRRMCAALMMILLPLGVCAQSNVVDEVIWVVGDEPILLSDVEEMRISAEVRGQAIDNPYCVIPEQLAIQKLFLHQADLDSVEVSEGDIIRAVDAEINMYIQNLGSKENVEIITRKTMAQLREQLKRRERDGERMRKVQQSITAKVKVTPAEVRDYFSKMPQDSLPEIPEQVEVQIITQTPVVSREEIERIEGELREFARRVNEGESEFSTLAMLYSQDGSAKNGGELGFAGRGNWVPEFSNVAFSLTDPKKVSKIVRTEFGFHIIQLIAKSGDKVNVRHILLRPEIADEEFAVAINRLDSIANDIRDGKFTFEVGAAVISDDKDTRNNHGVMVNKNEMTGEVTARFMMKDLPQDVAKVVDTLEVGQISAPFTMIDKSGQTVCAIVKLKNRIPAHRASMTEDFRVLKDEVVAVRSEKVINDWIREKQRTTFVRINKDWRNCNFEYPGWIK